jgi:CRISPR/Cas system-associated exonuclease Cas4 (RecB family)
MHNYANKYVRLSDISAYLLCPRLAYFRRRHRSYTSSPEAVGAAVFKEISRSLAGIMAIDDGETALRSQIEIACNDAEIVYGIPLEEILAEAEKGVADILAGLHAEGARLGQEKLLAMLAPCERGQIIYSDRLHISGSIDRITLQDGARCPIVVCASRPPENGIFAADRMKLATCAMLIEEKYGEPVTRGVVEYVCGWRVRETEIRKTDRMAVLSARNRIVQTAAAVPDARRGTWCATFQFADSCNVRPSFLGRLFRPMLLDNTALSRNRIDK